jgi:hypothetical protein
MTSSTLDTTSRITVRGAVSNAEYLANIDVPPVLDYTTTGQALLRAGEAGYFGWLDHVQAAAGCTRPVRLAGDVYTVRRTGTDTAEIIGHRSTTAMPDMAIYKACGNRRHTLCPSCARTYQADAFQLLRAGLIGGKGVPDTVAKHPAVFATLTAPGFGTVHTRHVKVHTCARKDRCTCRPEPCHARRNTGLCEHGRPAVCWRRHAITDSELGRPLCLDCYDHDRHAVFNAFAGTLWHRTKQAIERYLAHLCRTRRIPSVAVCIGDTGRTKLVPPVRVVHGKVAEMQRRAAIHFHALLRLDGVDPDDPDAVTPPPAGITVKDLDAAIRAAVEQVQISTPPHPDQPGGWQLEWGAQVDVEHLALRGNQTPTDMKAAGYLAKYATKATEVTGHASTRLNTGNIDRYADPEGDHIARLIDACWRLGRPGNPPRPLHQRPSRQRPAARLRPPWTCTACGTRTRLAVCRRCEPVRQAGIDTETADEKKPTTSSNPYLRLRRWAHMLGYGGHFLTKARRYSTTFAHLRGTRITFRRNELSGHPESIQTLDEEEALVVLGSLTFGGAGWRTTGDALLANTAAALARERQQVGREEISHEHAVAAVASKAA